MKRCIVALIAVPLIYAAAAYGAAAGEAPNGGGILYTTPVKSVLFTHKSHGIDQRLSCVRCHDGLFEMEALKIQEKKDFNMEAFYQGRYCGVCHNGRNAFAANTQCARCHIRVKGMGPQRDMPAYKAPESFGQAGKAVRFNHEIHARMTKCGNCHPGLFRVKKGVNKITQADHNTQKACFRCHAGRNGKAFYDCNRCHTDRAALAPSVLLTYAIKDYLPANFSHARHAASACDQCHPDPFSMKKGDTKMTMADMFQGRSCGACHDGKKVFPSTACARCHKNQ